MFFTLLAAADTPENYQKVQFQAMCMVKLLGLAVGREGSELLTSMGICDRNAHFDDPCDWNGVQCIAGVITNIRWTGRCNVRIISISWLPNTIMVLDVPQADINSELNTRMLPQRLFECDMEGCFLFGQLELQTLPLGLRSLQLANNKFTGTVKIANLPKDLRKIDLRLNPLKVVIVYNMSIPKHFVYARFWNREKKVKFRCVDGGKVDRRVCSIEFDSISSLSLSSVMDSDEFPIDFQSGYSKTDSE